MNGTAGVLISHRGTEITTRLKAATKEFINKDIQDVKDKIFLS